MSICISPANHKKPPKNTTATHSYTFHFFPPLLFLSSKHLSHSNTGRKLPSNQLLFFLLKFPMGLLKKIAGFLGFSKDDNHESKDEDDDNNNNNNINSEAQTHSNSNRSSAHFQETGLPRRGFSVPVQVSLERPHLGPLLSPCIPPDAAVQVFSSFFFLHPPYIQFQFCGVCCSVMIAFYHWVKIPIGFLCNWDLNPESLLFDEKRLYWSGKTHYWDCIFIWSNFSLMGVFCFFSCHKGESF